MTKENLLKSFEVASETKKAKIKSSWLKAYDDPFPEPEKPEPAKETKSKVKK